LVLVFITGSASKSVPILELEAAAVANRHLLLVRRVSDASA
jgi:hypothetical protein